MRRSIYYSSRFVKREKEKEHGRRNARKTRARSAQEAAHAEGGAFVGRRLQDRQEEEVPPLRDPDGRGVRDDRRGEGPDVRRASREVSQQPAVSNPASSGKRTGTLSSLAAALLAAGCWSTSAAGRPMAEVGHGRHGGHNIHRRQAPQARPHEGLQDALHRQRPLEPHEARDRAGQGRREIQRDHRHPRAPGPPVPQRRDRDDRRGRMPEEDRQEDTEARRGLCHLAQGQP